MPAGFTVSFSSSPPATPPSHRRGRHNDVFTDTVNTHLSTTPLAPPPSTANSFTPAGPPPPSSIWGSTFSRSGRGAADWPDSHHPVKRGRAVYRVSDEEDDRSLQDSRANSRGGHAQWAPTSTLHRQRGNNGLGSSLVMKRDHANSHREYALSHSQYLASVEGSPSAVLPNLESDIALSAASEIREIAKDLAEQLGPARLADDDAFVLDIETLVSDIYPQRGLGKGTERALEAALDDLSDLMSHGWERDPDWTSSSGRFALSQRWCVGPAEGDEPTRKAAFVAGLLLHIYHPRTPNPSAFGLLNQHFGNTTLSLQSLASYGAKCTEQDGYWDVLLHSLLRANVADVIDVLRISDFSQAHSIDTDRRSRLPYSAAELNSITQAVQEAIKILKRCPGVKNDDWDMSSQDWRSFRNRAKIEAQDLELSIDGGADAVKMAPTTAESVTTRSKHPNLPYFVSRHLRTLFYLVSGATPDVIYHGQDWLEATIFLAVWYRGPSEDLHAYESSCRRSKQSRRPSSDTILAYRRRLANAFAFVTKNAELHIDPGNAVEVGAACALTGDVAGCLSLLLSWSLPVAAAIAEVASVAEWLPVPPGKGPMTDGFNESDLMVLSYGKAESAVCKDAVITTYASALFARDRPLRRRKKEIEAWELAIKILGRLDDVSLAMDDIAAFVRGLDITSSERACKLVSLCRNVGLFEDAMGVAERYADKMAEAAEGYGAALVYYAYAHKQDKVRNMLELLISFCLVRSTAYPPLEQLDMHLLELLHDPRTSLAEMAAIDPTAAEILSTQLSGYATLREFYTVRDDLVEKSAFPETSSAQIRRLVKPLLAVVASAADNIQGGLFDQRNPAVVPVEGLLVLLGEASFLVQDQHRVLTLPQLLSLLRAVEDLQTVHPRILSKCNDCLAAALSPDHEANAAGPKTSFKKSISDVTTSSGFSLVGASMQEPGQQPRTNLDRNAQKAAWDWRQEFPRDLSPKRLLAMMRERLANSIADLWLDGQAL